MRKRIFNIGIVMALGIFALCPKTLLAADTLAELVAELNTAISAGGAHTINITNLDETHWTSTVNPNSITQDVQITLVSHKPMTITTDPNLRHFNFSVNTGVTLTFKLENITLDGGDDSGGIEVSNPNGTFEFAGGTITNCNNYNGGGIYADNLIISGGVISGNAGSFGGGVAAVTTATINGGTISGNTGASRGGGVYAQITATINGGTISGNTAGNGGGVYTYSANISGGAISGNTATHGGGVYADGTGVSTIMDGGTISGNTADQDGGGVFTNASATINSGTIAGNTAGTNGGGVYGNGSVTTIDGGTISGNTAGTNGGGVYARGSVTTTDGSVISGNTAAQNGGGVYAAVSASISGGAISGNTAAQNGGGIYCTVTNITGGAISANTGLDGGGVYINNANPSASSITGGRFSANLALLGGYEVDLTRAPSFITWIFDTVTTPYTHVANNHDIGFQNLATTLGFDGPNHVLSFMKNDGAATELARIAPQDASELFPKDPSWGAYEFRGWNRSQQGTGEWVKRITNFPVNQSARIYARWQTPYVPKEYDPSLYGYYSPYDEPIPDHSDPHKGGTLAYTVYQVKLDTSIDSTGKIPEIIVRVKSGEYLTEPKAPIKDGYSFTGWFTDKERTKPYDFDKKVSKSFTLYAGWEAVDTTVPQQRGN